MPPSQQQDTFIDDSDDFCPLCVEEFDLSDKHFKPCPCGYQICQFCYNNIRKNLNGLCPACRREYTDASMEFKQVSPEEYRAEQQKQSRKKQEQKQKEQQKREQEQINRKHLSGLRVVQKNLVYVTGLNPRIREEDLLQTLRGEQYFGQYGRIIKIVVNKRTGEKGSSDKGAGMGVYVTFQRKEDAASCIQAVDGSLNGDRVLRATYGTTKYCSAYLRNEQCPNKNCMFLHEQGEEVDSYTRQGLSSFNVQSSQQSQQAGPSRTAPPPQAPVTAATAASTTAQSTPTLSARLPNYQQHVGVKPSKSPALQEQGSPPSSESSALPSSASWAARSSGTPVNNQSSNPDEKPSKGTTILRTHPPEKRPTPEPRKVVKEEPKETQAQTSRTTTVKAPVLDSPEPESSSRPQVKTESVDAEPAPTPPPPRPLLPRGSLLASTANPIENVLAECVKRITSKKFRFCFDKSMLSEEDYEEILKMPPLIDKFGGVKRRERLNKERERELEEERVRLQQQAQLQQQVQHLSPLPLMQHVQAAQQQQQQQTLQPIAQQAQARQQATNQLFAVQTPQSQVQGPRTQTPGSALSQQQQNIMTASQGLMQQTQLNQPLPHHSQHHARSSSRYNFEGIKAAPPQQINPQQILQQQHLPSQGLLSGQIYGLNGSNANVQGPPPGLKSAATPPNLMGLYGHPAFGVSGMGSTNQQIGGHMPGHAKSESQDLMQMMRSGAGKRKSHLSLLGVPRLQRQAEMAMGKDADPAILQSRLGPQQHPLQHQLGLVGHSQQGGYLNHYHQTAAGGWQGR